MTPKEKAHELFDKYNELLSNHIFNGTFDIVKQSALIAVDEILDNGFQFIDESEFWKDVKQELLRL
jgi:hypothetical protein